MWEIFEALCKARGVSPSAVALSLGWSKSTVSAWRRGLYSPKQEKLMQAADYFGVSLDYLLTGEEKVTYYDDPETEELAQRMRDNPEFRMLFSAAKDASPYELRMIYELFKVIKKREEGEE